MTSTELGSDEGLGGLVEGTLPPKERLVVLKRIGASLVAHGRDLASISDKAGELLAASITALPIRSRDSLAKLGADDEAIARRVIEEAASLAGWVSVTAAVVPAPPPVVQMVKVLVQSAIEIRMVGELYAVYGDQDHPRDSAWLNTVLHAWAVGHPVAHGASAAVNARDIAAHLRQAYTELGGDDSRAARVLSRGRDGSDAARTLGFLFRRRLRFDPSTWERPTPLATSAVVGSAVSELVRGRLGQSAQEATGAPRGYLDEAWAQHRQARAAAATVVPGPADASVIARLNRALDLQDQHAHRLAASLHRPLPAGPVPVQRSAGTGDPLAQAHTSAIAADESLDLAEAAGHNPRRLAGWPVRLRNSLVYLLVGLVVLGGAAGYGIAMSGGEAATPGRLSALIGLLAAPLVSYLVSIIVIGRLFRPWLGGRTPRSPIVGFVLTAALTIAAFVTVAVVGLL